MDEIVVKIIVELLSTLGLATKELRRGRSSESALADVLPHSTNCDAVKFVKKVLGEKEIEAVLHRLERLTVDESRTTAAQTLEVVHGLVQNMRVIMDGDQMHSAYHLPFVEYPSV